MYRYSAGKLANKARHPDVWKKLEVSGKLDKHWPERLVVNEATEKLRSERNDEAVERIEVFEAGRGNLGTPFDF